MAVTDLFYSVAASFLFVLCTSPFVRHWARRWGFVDHPDGRRKVQLQGVAFGGGLVLLIGLLFGAAVGYGFLSAHGTDWGRIDRMSMGFFALAGVMICLVGLVDDRWGLRGRTKLALQIVAAVIALAGTQVPSSLDLFGWHMELGVFAYVFSLIWLLAAINSFNLIDGVDGLATTLGIVMGATIGGISIASHDSFAGLVSLCLAGSLLGFLPYNRSPASMYLGDAGSMLIGLVLGTISLKCSIKEATSVAAIPLICVWGVLLLDSAAAIIRRKLTGRSLYAADRGHLHHRLLTRGFSPNRVCLIVGGLAVLTGLSAVVSFRFGHDSYGAVMVMSVVAALAALRVFGDTEARLLARSLGTWCWSFFQPLRRGESSEVHSVIHLQGDARFEHLWDEIKLTAARMGMSRVRLHLHVPKLHQDIVCSWEEPRRKVDFSDVWHFQRPVFVFGQPAGQLVVTGQPEDPEMSSVVREFLSLTDRCLAELAEIVEGPHGAPVGGQSPEETVAVG